jgi:acyl-CoA thioester hydrolase
MMRALATGRVEPGWVDYNGHLNVAYYHMAFDQATERFLEHIGLGEDYLNRHHGSMFALEDHLTYQRELRLGDPYRIDLQLLDVDEKRVHYFQQMFHLEKGYLAATCEHLSVFVDMRERRSAPFPSRVSEKLHAMFSEHKRDARPPEAGRPMGIRRR